MTRKSRFKICVDRCHFFFYITRCVLHRKTAFPHNNEKNRNRYRDHQCQFPLDRKHNDQCTYNRHRRNKNILRRMMCKLCNIKKFRCELAHQLSHTGIIKVCITQFLNMLKQITPEIGFYPHTKCMSPVSNDISKN